jgi:PAS domain S-box-containing protein
MIARFTPDGCITFVNEAYRSYFASLLEIKDVWGHNIRDILQVKKYADVEKFLSSLSKINPIREIECVVEGKDRNRHWQTWSVRALFTTDGNPAEYQVVGRDITEIKRQKNTEHELRRNEQRSLAVILNAGSWIWEVDPEGVYRYSTPAVEQILGYRPDELEGKVHFYDLFDPSVKEGVKEATSAAFSRRESFRHFENLNRHRNGAPVVLNTSGTPIFDEDGTFSGYCGIDEDITERKATESAFQALVKSMVGSTGLNSLRKITENVSSWLGADCVMVGEIQPDNQTVNVLSMFLDGKEIPDFSYTLKGTPCDNVAERGFCLYPDNVIELFPESKDLVELNIRGYLGTPLRNSSGDVCGILCALFRNPIHSSLSMQEILDIIAVKASAEIERNQIERALEQSQIHLAGAMDLAHLVNWEFDATTGIFTFNDRFYALYATTAELEGGNQMSAEEYAKRFLHPDDQNLVIDEVNKALQATDPGYTSLLGHRIIRRDGEIRHIIVRFGITKDENGRTIKTHGANQDITELMRMENALRESEERYRQLVENLNDIVYTVDTNGIITYVSPVVQHQYGYSSSDLIGKPFTDVVFKDDIPNLQKRFAEMSTGIIVPFEWRLKHKDGSLSWVRSSTRPLRDDHGTTGFLGIVSDINREKKAEQALLESEARARAMIQAIPDMVFRMDRQGVFLDYKADVSDLSTQSEPTLVGRSNRDITPPEFADLIDLQIRTVLETGTTQTFEYELPIPGRGVRNYEARMVASGLNEVTAIVRDITERKLAQEALADSESFNRGLVENLPEYLSVYGSDGILLYVNPASANAWGFEAEEMIGTHVLSYIPLEYHKMVNANIAVRQKGGDIPPYEIEIITKNAVRRSVIVKATPIQYQNNPAILLLLIDITGRKRAEKALYEAAQYTRKLIEVSLDSLVTISPEGRITDVNAATEQVTGYSRDYLIGTDFSDYFTDLVRAKEGYRKVFDKGVVLDYPLEIRHKDGKITSVLFNATVYRDGTGKVQGVFAAARDITERKRVEDALKMANKKLSILSSITRHDINNQLAVLTGYLRILEKKQPDPTLSVYSQKVAAAAQRISTMILFTKEYEQLGVEGPVWQDIGKLAKMAAVDLLPENVELKVNTENYEIFADPMC